MHERLLLATPSRHAEVERRRKSPNRTKTGSGGRRGDSRICAAKMASAPIVGEWFLCPKESPWKLLAQFLLSRERDVANIIA